VNPRLENLGILLGCLQAGQAEISIYTLSGRRVWKQDLALSGAGYQHLTWDGRNQAGETVASGLYFVVLQMDGKKQAVRKVLVIK